MFSRMMVGAVLVLTALAGVVAAPAQASPSAGTVGVAAERRFINLNPGDNCYHGYFCAYEGLDLEGRGVAFFATEANWNAIPAEFSWISNRARSGTNTGNPGALEDVWVYPLPNFVNDPRWPAVCIPNYYYFDHWGELRPESNRWVDNC